MQRLNKNRAGESSQTGYKNEDIAGMAAAMTENKLPVESEKSTTTTLPLAVGKPKISMKKILSSGGPRTIRKLPAHYTLMPMKLSLKATIVLGRTKSIHFMAMRTHSTSEGAKYDAAAMVLAMKQLNPDPLANYFSKLADDLPSSLAAPSPIAAAAVN